MYGAGKVRLKPLHLRIACSMMLYMDRYKRLYINIIGTIEQDIASLFLLQVRQYL